MMNLTTERQGWYDRSIMARLTLKLVAERFAALSNEPERRRVFAVELLVSERRPSLYLSALRVIGVPISTTERDALLDLYAWLDAAGVKRDLNAGTRVSILNSLRNSSFQPPIALLEKATKTVEYAPPNGPDKAAPLRAAGLIALSDFDRELAGFHAARLLLDPETSFFSGEPAVSAARVLFALNLIAPLYAYVMRPTLGHSEVVAEALSALSDAPDSIVLDVATHILAIDDEPSVAAVYDLLLRRKDQRWSSQIEAFLQIEMRLPLLRYVATTIAAERCEWQIALLRNVTKKEDDERRHEIFKEALALIEPL